MSRIPSYAGRRTIFGAPRGWFFSKLDVASLHVILALRAARRAVFPVARCEIDGLSIAIRVSTPNEYHRADIYATKEPETIEWLRENLRDGDVFYDVGANIGLYSLYAAKLRAACRVFALEPESQNFGKLCGTSCSIGWRTSRLASSLSRTMRHSRRFTSTELRRLRSANFIFTR